LSNVHVPLENLNGAFQRLRQSGIDEELFDVVAGFEALTGPQRARRLRIRGDQSR